MEHQFTVYLQTNYKYTGKRTLSIKFSVTLAFLFKHDLLIKQMSLSPRRRAIRNSHLLWMLERNLIKKLKEAFFFMTTNKKCTTDEESEKENKVSSVLFGVISTLFFNPRILFEVFFRLDFSQRLLRKLLLVLLAAMETISCESTHKNKIFFRLSFEMKQYTYIGTYDIQKFWEFETL